MDRRTFLFSVALNLVAAPLASEAQQAGKVFRIGILANLRPSPSEPGGGLWQAFIQGLQELGYIEGRNITIEWRVSEGKYERLPDLAADLARRKVDVIVVPADQNALAARHVTRTIPIVVASSADPVGGGLVASLARPGGNITGLSATAGPEIVGKQLQVLKAMVPEVSRIGNPLESRQSVSRGLATRGKDCGAVVDGKGSSGGGARALTTSRWHLRRSPRSAPTPFLY